MPDFQRLTKLIVKHALGLKPLPKLFPAQRLVLDLEVFDDSALGVDDHDGMALTGPVQSAKSPVG
jgi:hypothetical protein